MRRLNLRVLWPVLRDTFSAWDDNDAPRMGAALAFYTILSLAPLVVLMIAIAGMIFGDEAAQQALLREVDRVSGHEGHVVVSSLLDNLRKSDSGTVASVLGALTLMFGASGVFNELRAALNRIWRVKPTRASVWTTIRGRLFSFGMVLAVGFLLLVSLLASTALAALGKFFGDFLPASEGILSVLNFVISTGGIAVLFALIFRYVPEVRVAWSDVRLGAILTALLFTIGKSLI
ncbi:MAG: putative ribonuclease, partial [Bryobacterales bacterium]|nr:putative ribonuclease [Bryobacterales bacterium]